MKATHMPVRERYLLSLWQAYLDTDRLHQLDRFLSGALREIKNAGKKDRLWYGDHLFAMMRFAWLAAVLEEADQRRQYGTHDLMAFIRDFPSEQASENALEVLRKLTPTRLWFWVSQRLGLREPQPLFKTLSAIVEKHDDLPPRLLWSGLAPHWAGVIRERATLEHWSESTLDRFIRQHASRPPIYLRTVGDHKPVVIDDLESRDMKVRDVDGALAVTGNKGLYEFDTYKAGFFEIQDIASQAIGQHVDPKPGELGWDACAGGGGKTLQLATLMKGRGAVYASDVRSHKLDEIKRRAKRAELHNIRTFAWSGDPLDRHPADVGRKGGFDWVLVDAPCTSSGTWRRNPDARWRCDAHTLADITALQAKLLQSASASVRPGGHLVYSTCSFLPAENEAIVKGFLEQNPNFTLVTQALHGNPKHDADTMFSARLQKAPPA